MIDQSVCELIFCDLYENKNKRKTNDMLYFIWYGLEMPFLFCKFVHRYTFVKKLFYRHNIVCCTVVMSRCYLTTQNSQGVLVSKNVFFHFYFYNMKIKYVSFPKNTAS